MVIAQCKGPDGRIRAPRLALVASEHGRRCVETALRLNDARCALSQLEEFHRQVLEEVAEESPQCAARIRVRLWYLLEKWGFQE